MIRADIKSLAAYHVQDSRGMVKLDAMENPFPLPEKLRTEWTKRLGELDVNRYPDADMLALRTKIAALDGLKPEQVLIGNGSDEIIQMLLMAADNGPCLVPEPTFVMYSLISRWLKRPVSSIPLDKDFNLTADKWLEIAAREKAAIAFFACPNNPTGNMWPIEEIRRIANHFKGLIVIDEAYLPFADQTHTSLIAPNVVVLRTFSKLGWAGLRFGYLLGDAKTIAELNKVRLPYNINSLTQTAVDFLLDHMRDFTKQATMIRKERERMAQKLAGMEGIEVFPSQANFLLIRLNQAPEIFEALKAKNILIKNMDSSHALLKNCLRVTIGSKEENNSFLAAIKEIRA